MDIKIIITAILTFIATGILAPFSKVIFEKIFSAYNPDPKKINSGIKNTLLFALRYLVPIANVIYLYISHKEVDKFLVLTTVFIFSVLVLNISLDMLFKFMDRFFINKKTDLLSPIISIIKELLDKSVTHDKVLIKLTEVQYDHINIANKLSEQVASIPKQQDQKQQPT
ncbi:hypothetical protein [Ferruginibacter sp.]|uniref:hypothetical protein n=1 Tax=Ferruginibacter sp. TaxID=1940288 RepID=UPI0019C7DC71|nr:hypothetical protein [Ferruginibacter sp.]MBC7628568.1 hypothetical protein [Ferruginibacter sp.]